jgi:hypothetical protein
MESDGLCAYLLYCASDFYAMCVAVSTKNSLHEVKSRIRKSEEKVLDSLKEHPDLLRQFEPSSGLCAEMLACEWEYIF